MKKNIALAAMAPTVLAPQHARAYSVDEIEKRFFRVKLLGRSIKRNPRRHYLGRIAATITSITLKLAVYDTQCGAKLFRNDSAMKLLFEEPLDSSWVFDVELIARLIQNRRLGDLSGAEGVTYELPLNQWHDVAGSKVGAGAFLRALLEMFRIHLRYLRE